MKFQKTLSTFRAKMNDMFDGFDQMFEGAFEHADAVDAATPGPDAGETVTTRTEETKPDGTRIVTTVTRSKRVDVKIDAKIDAKPSKP